MGQPERTASLKGYLVLWVVWGISPWRVRCVGVSHLARERPCLPRWSGRRKRVIASRHRVSAGAAWGSHPSRVDSAWLARLLKILELNIRERTSTKEQLCSKPPSRRGSQSPHAEVDKRVRSGQLQEASKE